MKLKDLKKEIIELSTHGHGSRKIAKILKEKYNLEEAIDDSSIRKLLQRYRNSFEKDLSDNNFTPPENWKHGWLKTKNTSVFIKNKVEGPSSKEFIDEIKQAISSEWVNTVVKNKVVKYGGDEVLFVPCIFDLHIGKLAWAEESGENYDAKIALDRFRVALDDLINKAVSYNPSYIVFPIGNDLYNSDKSTPFPQTTKGTPQTDDVRWQKMFRMGIRLITEACLKLSKIAPVKVITVFSNHDHERVFYLGETIDAVFNGHPNIEVDNSPKVRKYFKWGNVLLGFSHGHNDKPQNLPGIMAQEQPKLWGDTFYREWLLGHLHHRKSYMTQSSSDYNGVKVSYLSSLSAPDAWHFEKGFIGSIKGAEGFIYSKKEGIIANVYHNLLYETEFKN
jgi:hypothetical protein